MQTCSWACRQDIVGSAARPVFYEQRRLEAQQGWQPVQRSGMAGPACGLQQAVGVPAGRQLEAVHAVCKRSATFVRSGAVMAATA